MSKPPDIITGDTEAPAFAEAAKQGSVKPASERRVTHDLWLSGTEGPTDTGRFTDEGAQEMLLDEDPEVLAGQRGTLVVDDYGEDAVSDEVTQIINMGPQHPATHGVLRLHLELEGETIKRVKPIIGYLHTGMERTAEALTYMQGPTNVTR
ncbi:MAG: hypothetical protein WD652_01400, partial [Acidimicrobiia bacterium]